MNTRNCVNVCLVVCLLTVLPGTVLAGFIGTGDGNTVTATAGSIQYDDPAKPPYMVDGSGMSDNPVVKTSTAISDMNNTDWISDDYDTTPIDTKWVLFTFSNNTSLGEMVIWNGNGAPGYPHLSHMGLKDVTITYSTGSDASGVGNALFTGQLNCATGSDTQSYTDALPISAANVKAVKIAYTTNWYTGTEPSLTELIRTRYALSEVRFAVPEPSTLILLATGLFGLLAYAWRKRK